MFVPSRLRALVIAAAYFVAYLAADKAASLFEIAPGVSLWYPPPGLLLALLLVFGLRWIPLALGTTLFSAWFVYPMPEKWATLGMAVNVTAGYATVAAVIRAWLGRPPRLQTMSHALGFSLVLLAASLPMAWFGTLILQAVGLSAPAEMSQTVFRWWLGDTAGTLSILPLLLVNIAPRLHGGAAGPRRRRSYGEWAEIAGQVVALLGALGLIYAWAPLREHQIPYLTFVPLTWIVLRHGLPGAGVAIFAVNVGTVFLLKAVHASEQVLVSFLLFQFATTAMGLALGAMVTQRQRAEAEKRRLLEIVEATPDFIASATADGRVLYTNDSLRRLHGSDGAPSTLRELHSAAARDRLLQEAIPAAIAHGRWSGENALLAADGREIPVSQVVVPHRADSGGTPAFFTVARDISEQKRAEGLRLVAERKMLDAQKLESLGVLAGGIAHDFNNLLTTMLGNANLCRLDLPRHSPLHQHLQLIESAALQAAELCQQMLAYSGRSHLEMALVDLSALVNDTAHLLRVSLPKKATLQFDLPAGVPPVRADATQLRQVIMNLVLNAAEAIGERAGQIQIATGALRADAAWLAASFVTPPPPAGDYVYVEVTDDGGGMSAETQARMFEPFFTTKSAGHGLGLSAVLGIIRSHGGTLRVYTAPDQGTRFRVAFPAADRDAAPAATAPAAEPAWRGSGTVLLVDDEETVRVTAARLLESFGFDVELAANGAEAVDLCLQRGESYRAVVLDLVMPVMDGQQALEEIRRQYPDLPVLLVSGYSGRAGLAPGPGGGPTEFLSKPFRREALLEALRGLLETAASRPVGAPPSAPLLS